MDQADPLRFASNLFEKNRRLTASSIEQGQDNDKNQNKNQDKNENQNKDKDENEINRGFVRRVDCPG